MRLALKSDASAIIKTLMSGYSKTPLPKKLGLEPEQVALLLNVPKDVTSLSEFSDFVKLRKSLRNLSGRQFDYIHIFVKDRQKLESIIPQIHPLLLADGMVWVSWPKKSSGVKSDVTEGVLRDVILPCGLVDIKVCAVNEVWSGLKFMFRKELRTCLVG